MEHLFHTVCSFIDIYRQNHNNDKKGFDITTANGHSLAWSEFCLNKKAYEESQVTESFISKYFEIFYESSYVRTAILEALWAGSFASCSLSTLRMIFSRVSEHNLADWIPWMSLQNATG